MKKSFFILLVFILVINQNIFSQDADNDAEQSTNQYTEKDAGQSATQNVERKFTLQASPLLWFTNVVSTGIEDTMFAMDLEGQIKMSRYVNLSLTLSFLLNNHVIEDYRGRYKENIYQANLKPMFVYRPFGTGLQGFYLGFYPNVGVLHVENQNINQLYTELGLGMNIGYKWVFKNGFTLQLGNGFGRTLSFPEGSRQYVVLYSDGRIPIEHTDILLLDFKLGYSF